MIVVTSPLAIPAVTGTQCATFFSTLITNIPSVEFNTAEAGTDNDLLFSLKGKITLATWSYFSEMYMLTGVTSSIMAINQTDILFSKFMNYYILKH